MVWFTLGMLLLIAGGASTLWLVFHLTQDHQNPVPFTPDDQTPVGDTPEHSESPA